MGKGMRRLVRICIIHAHFFFSAHLAASLSKDIAFIELDISKAKLTLETNHRDIQDYIAQKAEICTLFTSMLGLEVHSVCLSVNDLFLRFTVQPPVWTWFGKTFDASNRNFMKKE